MGVAEGIAAPPSLEGRTGVAVRGGITLTATGVWREEFPRLNCQAWLPSTPSSAFPRTGLLEEVSSFHMWTPPR